MDLGGGGVVRCLKCALFNFIDLLVLGCVGQREWVWLFMEAGSLGYSTA